MTRRRPSPTHPADEPAPPGGETVLHELLAVIERNHEIQAEAIVGLRRQIEAQAWCPLGSVAVSLSYEAARQACKKGLVRAEKRGGRLFVDAGDLVKYASRKAKV